MASGWWETTHDNLAEGSPVDFTVTTRPSSPRGYPKIASIATGAGMFLGGTPCVSVDDVIYYAGDDYTQDTDNPPLMRWDGRLSTLVVEAPLDGIVPAKAILSITQDEGVIYFSTWDAGTTSSDFSGRVFKFDPDAGTLDTFGDDVFSSGRLPYMLAIFDGDLVVGVTRQDPTRQASLWTINLTTEVTAQAQRFSTGEISAPTISSVTRATTTTSYRVSAVVSGTESGPSNTVSVVTDPVLDGSTFNTITWAATVPPAVSDPSTAPTPTAIGGSGSAWGGTAWWFTYVYSTSATSTNSSFVTRQSDGGGNISAGAGGFNIQVPYSTNPTVQYIHVLYAPFPSTSFKTYVGGPLTIANNSAGGTASIDVADPALSGVLVEPFPDTNTTAGGISVTYNVYRTAGHTSTGKIVSLTAALSANDTGLAGSGSLPSTSSVTPPVLSSVVATDPVTTTTYTVTANTAEGETNASTAVSTTAKATLTASRKVTVVWAAVGSATSYNVYRTVGHSSTGKIVNATASTSAEDTGLAGSGSAPIENTTGNPYGGVGCMLPYGDDLYVGLYQEASAFATVQKVTPANVLSTSTTAAPGGTARSYNGFTSMVEFEDNLYAGYWNDDTTDICEIYKFDGASWTSVKTISGAGARPWIVFHVHGGKCYAYGGGDAQTGILYSTSDGATWTDISSLLPTSREAVPFIGTANVVGGF